MATNAKMNQTIDVHGGHRGGKYYFMYELSR